MKRFIASFLAISFILSMFVVSACATDLTGVSWSVPSSTQESKTGIVSTASWRTYTFAYPVALYSGNGFGSLPNVLLSGNATGDVVASNYSPSPASYYPLSKGTFLNVRASCSVSFGTMPDSSFIGDCAAVLLFYDSSGSYKTELSVTLDNHISPSVLDSSVLYSVSKIVDIPVDGTISFCVLKFVAKFCTSSYISFTPGSPSVYISGSSSTSGDTVVNVDTTGIEALLAEIKAIVTSICSNSDTANDILNSINGYVIDLYDNSTNCITYLEKVENILSTQLVEINNSLKGISIDDLSIQAIIDGLSASITFEPSDLSGVEEYLDSILNQISHISSVVDAISEKLDISNEWFAQFASDLFDIKSDVGFCSTYLQGLYNTLLGMDDDIAAMRDFLEENNANILLILQEVQSIHSSLGDSVGSTLDAILRNLVSQGTDLGSIKSLLSSIKDNSDAAANTLDELLKELQKVEAENVLTNERLQAILDAIDDFEIDVSKTTEKILTDEDSKGLGGLISKIINHLLSVIDFVSDLFGDVFTSIPSTISAFNDCNQFWGDTKTYVYTPHQISGYAGQGGSSFDNSNTSVQSLFSEAEKYLGYPYVFGGSSPETSFDCSGYVCYVLNHSGVYSIERTSAQGIYNLCEPVSRSAAKPGDLVFFSGTYDCPDIVSHVGFYAGDGKMLHAGDPIQYTSIDTSYWQSHFYSFGRLPFNVETPVFSVCPDTILIVDDLAYDFIFRWDVKPSASVSSVSIYVVASDYDCCDLLRVSEGSTVCCNYSEAFNIADEYGFSEYDFPFGLICVATLTDGSLLYSDTTFFCSSDVYSAWGFDTDYDFYNTSFSEDLKSYIEG